MPPTDATYFVCWCRWQQQNWYLLWWTSSDRDALWADAAGRVPRFATPGEVASLAECLEVQLAPEEPSCLEFDLVFRWLSQPAKNPPKEALVVWSMFDDLSSGIGKPFWGNQQGTVRNRVFDKLYLNDGLMQLNQKGQMEFGGRICTPGSPGGVGRS